ncbi:hypothetical protein DVH24_007530 [Malus domestica]|uniref:Uncharacterized protein n=1 Tax=Malus domestica TaxID=3750 RepID=A0A498HIX4_MALDO|nr:hypothetical protein DVH24_007530 [Malus domestica]
MCTTSRAATCGTHSTESHTLTQVHYLPVIFVSAQHTYESKHQSPHQLAKAKEKEPLKECRKIEGDADDLPYPTDYVDRYASPIHLAGRQVYIEKQRPNSTGLAARGRAEAEEVTKLMPQGGVLVAGVQAGVVTDGDYNRLRGNGFHQRGKATPPADT